MAVAAGGLWPGPARSGSPYLHPDAHSALCGPALPPSGPRGPRGCAPLLRRNAFAGTQETGPARSPAGPGLRTDRTDSDGKADQRFAGGVDVGASRSGQYSKTDGGIGADGGQALNSDEEKDQKPSPPKSETPSRPKRRRRHLLVLLVLLSMLGGLLLYVRSDSFHEIVRRRVIAELEAVTGGKAEVDSITWTLLSLKFEIRGLTIHGEEGPGQIPFLHADRLTAQARIVSFFSQRIGLRSLVIEDPVVHLIVRPDGSTNQPARGLGGIEDRPLQALFDLDIGRIEISNGELVLNEKKLAFDLGGDRFAANLSYSKTDGAYSGNIAAADLAVRYQKKTPLHGSLETGFVIRPAQIEIKT